MKTIFKKRPKTIVFNVVVYTNTTTYPQIKKMEKLLKTRNIKFNGRFSAQCKIRYDLHKMRAKIVDILEVSDKLINLSFYELKR